MSNIIPCGYRILIEKEKVEKVSESGIILAVDEKVASAAVDKGTVLAIGPDAFADYKEPWCKVGDFVGYVRYAGKVLLDDAGKETNQIVMNDEDVVLVYKKEGV